MRKKMMIWIAILIAFFMAFQLPPVAVAVEVEESSGTDESAETDTDDPNDDGTPSDDDDETHVDDNDDEPQFEDDNEGSDDPDKMEMIIDMPKVDIIEWTMTSKYSEDNADEMRRKIDMDEDDEVTLEEIETLQESVSEGSDGSVGMEITIDGHFPSKTTMSLEFKGAEGDVYSGEPLTLSNTVRMTFDDVDTKKDRHTIDFEGEDKDEGDDDDEVKEPEGIGDDDDDDSSGDDDGDDAADKSDDDSSDDALDTRVDDEDGDDVDVDEEDYDDSPDFSQVVFNAPSGWSIDPDTLPSTLEPYLSKDKGSLVIAGDDFEDLEDEDAPTFDIVEGEIEDDDDEKDEEEEPAVVTETFEEGVEETVEVGDVDVEVTMEEVDEEAETATFDAGDEKDITLEVGESREIDTDGDGEDDMEVELEKIKDGEAKLKFTELKTKADDDDDDTPGFSSVLLICALGLVGVAMMMVRRRRK